MQFTVGPTYLITRDIAETLERKFGYALCGDARSGIARIEDGFLSDFWPQIPDNMNRAEIEASDASLRMDSLLSLSELPVISLDRVYATKADGYLEVTRITDPITGKMSLSERPGKMPLENQMELIGSYGRVVAADAGAFEGSTILEVCEMIEDRGASVEGIYLGISSPKVNSILNKNRRVVSLYTFEDLAEWIEMRDFLGIDGRNVGYCDGKRIYIPYWENLSEWASIPGESLDVVKEVCMDYNANLMGLLEGMGYSTESIGRPIRLGEGWK